MKKTRILSVDWDYFFPDNHIYDWGHGETTHQNLLYGQIIWPLRYHNRSIYDPHNEDLKASKHYWPSEVLLKNFWQKTVKSCPAVIILADSHLRLAEHVFSTIGEHVTEKFYFDQIDNYDAHHDYGYHKSKNDLVDCGNWARVLVQKGYVKQYKLYYPPWRREMEEGHKHECVRKAKYTIQRKPQDYAIIFVCQSRSWTPPWADNRFTFFVNELVTKYSKAKLYHLDEVMTARPFEPGPDVYKMQQERMKNDPSIQEALKKYKEWKENN